MRARPPPASGAADLLLLCGIFGNIPDADVERTVAALPALLADGGTVIWTRHTRAPDLTPRLRAWCGAAGVVETAFVTGDRWSVGAGVHQGRARAARAGSAALHLRVVSLPARRARPRPRGSAAARCARTPP